MKFLIDPQSRLRLYHFENEPLESSARHADQILSRTTSQQNSAATTIMVASNQRLINEIVETKLDNIERNIARLNRTAESNRMERNTAAGTQRDSYSERTPFRFIPPHRRKTQFSPNVQNNLCRYHTQYGERASRCEGPFCSLHHLTISQVRHRTTTSDHK